MGVNPHAAAFLVAARNAGADFDRAVTIGRQRFFLHPGSLQRAFARAGSSLSREEAERLIAARGGFVEPLLERLGAAHVDSVDASGYEQSTFVHDMNQPVPSELEGAYSVVIDSGSLEHVFDFPTAVANCMRMARVGGHVLLLTPAHGEMGQGFYQFSPELLYRVFAPENGFRVEHMLLKDARMRSPWYSVADPREAGGRVVMTSGPPAYLYVMARRERGVVPFGRTPQQSDYAALWEGDTAAETSATSPPAPAGATAKASAAATGAEKAPTGATATPATPPPSRLGALVPEALKERLEDARSAAQDLRRPARDPRFFREVDLSRLNRR
jgi:hypothetical protein